MKRVIVFCLLALLVVLICVPPTYAGGHVYFRGGVWVGPGWGGPAYPYYYPYYTEPPLVIERRIPVYDRPARLPDAQDYWYYCPDLKAYYPYVRKCPSGWLKVVPSAPSDNEPSINSGPSQYEKGERDRYSLPPEEKRY